MAEKVSLRSSNGLIVGINYYTEPNVSDLKYAVADATDLYDVLLAPPYNCEKERLLLLKSTNEKNNDARRRNILQKLQDVAKKGQPEDLLLFYYAGHGIYFNGVPYLCPADVDRTLLQDTSIPLSRVRDIVENSRASIKLLILDACHLGVSLQKDGNREAIENVREFREQARKIFEGVQGIAMLAASSQEEAAMEIAERKHGAFTYFLLEALRDLHTLEQNQDNQISVMELFNYVARKLKNEFGQEATILLESSGDLPIFPLPPPPLEKNPVNRVFPQPVKNRSDFFGQDEALQKVKEKLLSTTDILIFVHGERGVGKTSFINYIKMMLDEEISPKIRFLHFSVEAGGIRTVNDLARELWEGLTEVCRRTSTSFSWKKTFSFDSYTGFGFKLEEMLRSVPDARFVVFLDDADKLFDPSAKLLDKQVLALISFLIQRTNLPIAFVLASLYDQRQFFDEYGSPPSILEIHLEPLQRVECDVMLDSLFDKHIVSGKTIRKNQYEQIYRLSGGNPYLAKLLASIYWKESTATNTNEPNWEAIIEQAINEVTPFFDFVYKNVNERERFVLLNMALKPKFFLAPADMAAWKTDKKTAARALERKHYLLPLQDGGYRLRIDLFGEWFQRWTDFPLECERLNVRPIQSLADLPDSEGICVDLKSGKVYVDGVLVNTSLSNLQYQALVYLAGHVGRVVSRQELFKALHAENENYLPTDQSLDALVYRLRFALGDREQRYLQTLRKRGYLLKKGRLLGESLS